VGDVVISEDVLGSGIGRWLGVEYPRPGDPGTGRGLSRDDTWLGAVVVVCSFALVAGCLAVTLTVRGLRGDTGPVIAAVRACAAEILVVGLVCVVVWRRAVGRRLRELTRTKERFCAVYGAGPAGIVETNLQQRIVHCNTAFGAMLGLGAPEILGHPGWEFFHPDSPPPGVAVVQEMVSGVRASHSAVRLLRAADGSPLPVKLDWAAITGPAGAVRQLACVVTDVSGQARTAAALVWARKRSEVLWQQASVGVIKGRPMASSPRSTTPLRRCLVIGPRTWSVCPRARSPIRRTPRHSASGSRESWPVTAASRTASPGSSWT
jgi:PAS domain S-box-containing protein